MKEKLIQSFIANISYPKSLNELRLDVIKEREMYDVELVLNSNYLEWTSPKWCKKDDIVFLCILKQRYNILQDLSKN